MKLDKSMVEYVKLQSENNKSCVQFENDCYNYANFLSQKLELWMFVACDENGKPLAKPKNYDAWVRKELNVPYDLDLSKYEQFETAQSKVIFEGFDKCDRNEFVNCIYNKDLDIHIDADFKHYKTIEDLITYNLDIKESLAQELGLI